MRLIKHASLLVADRVLTNMRYLAKEEKGRDLTVSCYANCREQGYHIINWQEGLKSRAVSFSEDRNSDDIRVWYGPGVWFGTDGVPVNDNCVSRSFRHKHERSAAAFALRYLLTGKD